MSGQILEVQPRLNEQARQVALEAFARHQVEPTGLVQYHSRGRVLVIGGSEAMEAAQRLNGGLQPLVLLTDGGGELPAPVLHQGGRSLAIEGYLGNFQLRLGEPGESDAETIKADLVLDLGPAPLLPQALTPPGYLHCTGDDSSIASAVATLAGMVGSFERPTYVSYDPDVCAHRRSGHTACSRCIDACPAQAITSLAESIQVDPNLCQGGGICATACPSGALRYTYPTARDTQERIRLMLQSYRQRGGIDPVVVLFTEVSGAVEDFARHNCLPVMLEELPSAGLDSWLTALAHGARRLLLVDDGGMPEQVRETLVLQLQTARDILKAMDYPQEAIALIDRGELEAAAHPLMPLFEPAGYYALEDKRQGIFMAVDHLYAQAARSKPMAVLRAGAPFGAAQVDGKACTLCMSCVSACPGQALQHGQGVPQLRFIEANCLQCGMCTRTCPEDAIWITPRLLFDRDSRTKPRVLHEEEPFNCTVCDKPFATRSVIDVMRIRLRGHWMYQNPRARERLTMCDECRVVDALQDKEAMQEGQDGQLGQ